MTGDAPAMRPRLVDLLGQRAACLAALTCVALLMWTGPWLMSLAGPNACAYRVRTGRPCLGCGGTHAFERAVRGDLLGATRLNPLGAFAGAAAWLILLGALAGSIAGRLKSFVIACLIVGLAMPAVVGAAWVWWLNMPSTAWP